MQGVILNVGRAQSLILGDDGQRYAFTPTGWGRDDVQPQIGMRVDFEVRGSEAVDVYPILSSTTDAPPVDDVPATPTPTPPPTTPDAPLAGPPDTASAPPGDPGGRRRLYWALAGVGALVVVAVIAFALGIFGSSGPPDEIAQAPAASSAPTPQAAERRPAESRSRRSANRCADQYAVAGAYVRTRAGRCADQHARAHRDAYTHAYARSHCNADSHGYARADCDADSHAYTRADCDADSHAEAYGNAHCDTYAHAGAPLRRQHTRPGLRPHRRQHTRPAPTSIPPPTASPASVGRLKASFREFYVIETELDEYGGPQPRVQNAVGNRLQIGGLERPERLLCCGQLHRRANCGVELEGRENFRCWSQASSCFKKWGREMGRRPTTLLRVQTRSCAAGVFPRP